MIVMVFVNVDDCNYDDCDYGKKCWFLNIIRRFDYEWVYCCNNNNEQSINNNNNYNRNEQ